MIAETPRAMHAPAPPAPVPSPPPPATTTLPARRALGRRVVVGLLVLAALCGVAKLLWKNVFRDWFYPHDWGVVEPGKVYRSGQLSSHLIRRVLQEHHVGVIVSMSGDLPDTSDVQAERRVAAELGIPRVDCNLKGNGTGDLHKYARALATIVQSNREGKVVLVHCQAGAQRTSGVTAYYRVLVQRKSPREAYAEMLHFGHDPRSNPKLVPYLNEHMAELAAMLVEMKVIDAAPDPLPVIGP